MPAQRAGEPSRAGPENPALETVPYQQILTPVPVRVSLPVRLGVEHVTLFYRTFGAREWGGLELARYGQTWAGAVNCLEVSTITGNLQFFLHGYDLSGKLVASSGAPGTPHVVAIVHRLPQGPIGLSGDPPLMACPDPADCPPGFPGCPHYVQRRPPCYSNDDCADGDYCAWDGYCDSVTPEFASLPFQR